MTKAQATRPPNQSARKPPPITSPQLAKASAHPIRVKLMAALTMKSASPRELAEEIDEPLNLVNYHLGQLRKLGCVELVEVVAAAGGRVAEHIYRGVQRPYMSIEAWNGLTEQAKHGWVMTTMRLVTEDIEKAMSHGVFLDPDDNHISRSPMVVDAGGWAETLEILDRAVEELIEVEARSAVRLKGSAAGEIFQKVEILHFRSPTRV